MRETLLALACPLILSASGIYAGVSCWWRRRRRRRGVLPRDVHPAFYGRSRAGLVREREALAARLDAIKAAEGVVRAAYGRVGPLYDTPVPPGESSSVVTAELIVAAEYARTITEER